MKKINFLIAIDPSISSTSICAYNINTQNYYFFSYSDKISKDLTWNKDNIHIKIIRQEKMEKNFERYIKISK